MIRPWALDLLLCPACGAGLESSVDAGSPGASCGACGRGLPVREGIVEGLGEAHPAVVAEQRAVAALDAGEVRLGAEVGSEEARRAVEEHVATCRRQLGEVLVDRPLPEGAVVVDLGADSCWASEIFVEAGARVVAVDISDHLRLARLADHPDLLRLRADMNDLPLREGSVDVVWATAAAHHSWDLAKTFAEAARILRKDGAGRLHFCCEPMPSWLRYPFGLAVGDDERALGINETWIPRSAWLRHARAAGFDASIEMPKLDAAHFAARLRRRGVPRAAVAVLRPLLAPVLPWLQVSVHLHGRLTA